MKKRLLAVSAAAILGGALVTAVNSTPAFAVNNFIVHWGSPRGTGTTDEACNHGMSYGISTALIIGSFDNNCDVRVWAYDPNGFGQCINPGKQGVASNSQSIGRIFISDNSAPC